MTKSVVIALAMALSSASAFAVDGQVLINTSLVNATGGFPFKITQPGSYKLSGNLTLPDANTTGIQILSNAVTLDLNGFGIIGPGTQGTFGFGNGVQIGTQVQAFFNITIRNGTIQGAGGKGVWILGGDSVIVEEMNIGSNADYGIFNGTGSAFPAKNIIVRHNTIAGNGSGVGLSGGCIVADNTVSVNSFVGISVAVCNVARNTIIGNGSFGLAASGGGYQGNVISGNGGAAVISGVNLGGNACNGSLCP